MLGSTIFIAGVYGTGKSTICSALSENLHIPSFSAGDLISELNGELYGANKAVSDRESNQVLLTKSVEELHRKNAKIILAGHFCIFNTDDDVEVLPESVYSALKITRIVLLEADVKSIVANLYRRDGKKYSNENISTLLKKEREQSERISKQLKCPLDVYRMTFTDKDIDYVTSLLCEGG